MRVRVRDLDVEAVDAVVFDLEVRDARALALAALERDQELAAVLVDRPQLVELGVVALGDDAAVSDLRRRLRRDRPAKAVGPLRIDRELRGDAGHEGRVVAREQRGQCRQPLERVAQPREVARPGGPERDARGDALDVGGVSELRVQRAARARIVDPRGDARVPGGRRVLRAQRMREPLPQHPAARRGRASVEQRQERRGGLAAQRLGDLEIAPRRVVEREEFAGRLDGQRAHVRERGLLRGGRVAEERAGGAEREVPLVDAERREVLRAEVLRQRPRGRARIELPGRELAHRHAGWYCGHRGAVRDQHLGHVEPLDTRGALRGGHFGERELTGREVEPRDAGAMTAGIHGHEQAVALGVEQVRIGHRARRHDALHLALDRALAGRRIADLLADRDRLAELHQLGEIPFDGVVRHARHRNRRAGRRAARGERDVEELRRAFRVVVEELVEVAHPVEQELVRMLRLRAEVLLHHRRVLRCRSARGFQGFLFHLRELRIAWAQGQWGQRGPEPSILVDGRRIPRPPARQLASVSAFHRVDVHRVLSRSPRPRPSANLPSDTTTRSTASHDH